MLVSLVKINTNLLKYQIPLKLANCYGDRFENMFQNETVGW